MTIQGFMESGPLVWDFIYHCIRETHDRENRGESWPIITVSSGHIIHLTTQKLVAWWSTGISLWRHGWSFSSVIYQDGVSSYKTSIHFESKAFIWYYNPQRKIHGYKNRGKGGGGEGVVQPLFFPSDLLEYCVHPCSVALRSVGL